MLQSDDLHVIDERIILELVEAYLLHRNALPLLPEEDPAKDWSMLTAEERKQREEQQQKEAEEKKTKHDEEEKAKNDAFAALDDAGKIQSRWNDQSEERRREATARLALKRLPKREKDELFRCVRFAFLQHDELIVAAGNAVFEQAKDYILQGMSCRLGGFEKKGEAAKERERDFSINTKPRKSYDPEILRKKEEERKKKEAEAKKAEEAKKKAEEDKKKAEEEKKKAEEEKKAKASGDPRVGKPSGPEERKGAAARQPLDVTQQMYEREELWKSALGM